MFIKLSIIIIIGYLGFILGLFAISQPVDQIVQPIQVRENATQYELIYNNGERIYFDK